MCERWTVDEPADRVVGTPLPRETIRTAQRGYLAVCSDSYCEWQGLFPSRDLAAEAVATHVERARRSRRYEYHYGEQYPFVIELVDDRMARVCPDQELDPLEPWHSNRDGQYLARSATDRSVLDAVLHRGDLVESHGPRRGKVYRVSETRALGLPAYSVIYVEPDVEPNQDGTYPEHEFKYLNNYVARDGGMLSMFREEDFLAFADETCGQVDLARFA